MRFYTSAILRAQTMPPDEPICDIVCTRRDCNATFVIAWAALLYAEAVGDIDESLPWAA